MPESVAEAPAQKQCKLSFCEETFVPRSRNHKYCLATHRRFASRRGLRRMTATTAAQSDRRFKRYVEAVRKRLEAGPCALAELTCTVGRASFNDILEVCWRLHCSFQDIENYASHIPTGKEIVALPKEDQQ